MQTEGGQEDAADRSRDVSEPLETEESHDLQEVVSRSRARILLVPLLRPYFCLAAVSRLSSILRNTVLLCPNTGLGLCNRSPKRLQCQHLIDDDIQKPCNQKAALGFGPGGDPFPWPSSSVTG